MIKPLIILFNTVSVFLFSFFFGDTPVTVTGNFPKNAKPNTEFVVELKVNKGNIGGFAKLQLEVPQGFTVKELDNKGGNFAFSANIAKIIWTATPSDPEFTVKFNLIADASVSGAKTFASKFSYVNNNNKEVVEMAPTEVFIGDAPAENPVATNTTPATVAKTETTTPNNNPFNNPTEPSSDVTCARVITPGTNPNEFNVEVKIKKPAIKGFAKYQEVIPAGYTVKGGKTSGSSFSFSDSKAKFVWVALPAEDEMIVSFVIEKGSSANSDAKFEGGEFSYLESDKTKKVKMPAEFIDGRSSAIVENSTPVTTQTVAAVETNTTSATSQPTTQVATNNEPVKTEPVNNEPVKTEPVKTEPVKNEPVTNNTVAKKEGSIAYAVQVGAFRNAIQSDVLSKKFNISETIKSEMAEGYSKFMVGNFNEYKQARDHREGVKQKGCRSAFVVAYNGPKRITVQEALMITSQKWFK